MSRVIGSQWKGQTVCASTIVQCPYVPYAKEEKEMDNKVDIADIDWSKSHPGVYLTDYALTLKLMPEVKPILDQLAESEGGDDFWNGKLIDVKVHMLMPKQFPCIPDWHYDFRPRNDNGKRIANNSIKVGTGEKMWTWLSGAPFTEFVNRNTGKREFSKAQEWHSFTQDDIHRGTASKEHTWRCFIRVIPAHLAHSALTVNVGGLRRHCQVYLDANDYRW